MINKETYKRLTKVHIAKDGDGSGFETGTKWVEKLSQDGDILHRLAELEDKIENGTLFELPCKVGDKFWWVNEYRPTLRIEEYEVLAISIEKDNKIYLGFGLGHISSKSDEIYFTKEKAEARLKELQEKSL